jgi:hypothetical protein
MSRESVVSWWAAAASRNAKQPRCWSVAQSLCDRP